MVDRNEDLHKPFFVKFLVDDQWLAKRNLGYLLRKYLDDPKCKNKLVYINTGSNRKIKHLEKI